MGRAGLMPAGEEGERKAGLHSHVRSWLLGAHHGWQALSGGFPSSPVCWGRKMRSG